MARLRRTSAASVPALVANSRDLAAVIDALLQHLLGVFGVLGDPVLGRGRLRQIAQQRREILEAWRAISIWRLATACTPSTASWFAWLIASILRRWQAISRLDIERPKAEIGQHLGHIKIERVGTSIGHGWFRIRGYGICAVHNEPISGRSAASSRIFAVQHNLGGNGVAITVRGSRRRRATSVSMPPQPPVERRHGRREIRRVVAQPDPHRRKIGRRGQLYRHGAADPAGCNIRRFEHPAASSATARPRRPSAATGRSAIRGRALRAPLYRAASASNRRISRSNTRSRGRSSGSAWPAARPGPSRRSAGRTRRGSPASTERRGRA